MKKICSGCGMCIATYPIDSISLAIHDFKMCPFEEYNTKEYDLDVFKKVRKTEYEKLFGIYSGIYLGYSLDEDIRRESSSGGLITTILIYLLERGYIDGAIVSDFDENGRPYPKIATTKEEILKAKGSKYSISPTNIVIKNILKEDSGSKYAFVGLPCQIQAMRKLEKLSPKLKDRITIYLGLMCSNSYGNKLLDSQKFLLNAVDIKMEDIEEMMYRGEGWPGKFSVTLKNGSRKSIRFFDYTRIIQLFTPVCCFVCWDSLSEYADISFGDAWLPEIIKTDREGTSIVISRTARGDEILRECQQEGILSLRKGFEEDLIMSQKGSLYRKKSFLRVRLAMAQILGYNKPEWSVELQRAPIKGTNDMIKFLKIMLLSSLQYGNILLHEKDNVLTKNLRLIMYRFLKAYLKSKVIGYEKA